MKRRKNGIRWNLWKWLFLLMLTSQLALAWIIWQRIQTVREPYLAAAVKTIEVKDAVKVGSIHTNREQLNQTLTAFLEEYQNDSISYKVYASTSNIVFEGTYTVLGYQVPLYVYFEPYQLESGTVQLKITSFSAGSLPLPEGEILTFISKTYELPKIVEIKPKESVINIHLQNIENNTGIYLKATSIDLIGDAITFDIYKKNKVN